MFRVNKIVPQAKSHLASNPKDLTLILGNHGKRAGENSSLELSSHYPYIYTITEKKKLLKMCKAKGFACKKLRTKNEVLAPRTS